MKGTLSLLFCVGIVLPALPQGQVIFNNRVAGIVVAPVYDVDPANPTLALHGNTSAGTPPGTQTYGGAPLTGTGFSAQLFGGPANAAVDQLEPLGAPTTFRTGELAGFIVPPPQALLIPGVPEGHRAKLQMRAWNNRGGTIITWQQAAGDRLVASGRSEPFISPPLGGISNTPPNLIGLESFNIALPVSDEPQAIYINFQTNGAPVPAGYVADAGEIFGDRSGGLRYGWSVDVRADARDRDAASAPDQRYDSFVYMDRAPGAVWELALPDGNYLVRIAAGDPDDAAAVYRIAAEGILIVSGTPSPANPWVEGAAVVPVSDGRLTIASAPGAFDNRICFLDVFPVPQPRLRGTRSGGEFDLRFAGVLGAKYDIEGTMALAEWVRRGLAPVTVSNQFAFSEPAAGLLRAYRSRLLLPKPVSLVYQNDFESGAGAEWSNVDLALSPAGSRRFLGRFGSEATTLTVTNLPPHSKLTVTFELYVIGNWNSVDRDGVRDTWSLRAGGTTLLRASFSNATGSMQSYPANEGVGMFPARTGAAETNSLGYSSDAVYRLSYTFAHSGSTVQLTFEARASEPLSRQSWGVDNVRVLVEENPY